MNQKVINPDNYHWLRRFPWTIIIILLLVSMLGTALQFLATNPVITIILGAFDSSLAHQISDLAVSIFNLGWKLAVCFILIELIAFAIYHYQGIAVIRSFRLTHYLQRALRSSLDVIPQDNIDRRITATEINSKRANTAIRDSIVVIFKDSAVIFIKVPIEASIRYNVSQYADEVASDIADIVNMRKSARQEYHDSHSFAKYYYFELNC